MASCPDVVDLTVNTTVTEEQKKFLEAIAIEQKFEMVCSTAEEFCVVQTRIQSLKEELQHTGYAQLDCPGGEGTSSMPIPIVSLSVRIRM
jgi:hypothetical protein